MKARIQSLVRRMRNSNALDNLVVSVVCACVINVVFLIAVLIIVISLDIPFIADVLPFIFIGFIPTDGFLIIYIGRLSIRMGEDPIINLLLEGKEGDPQYNPVRKAFRQYRTGGYAYRKMCKYLHCCTPGTVTLDAKRRKECVERCKKISAEEEKNTNRFAAAIYIVLPVSLGLILGKPYGSSGDWRWVGLASLVITLAWAARTFLDIGEEDEFLW